MGFYKVRYTDLDEAEPTYASHYYNRVTQERDGGVIGVAAGAETADIDTVMIDYAPNVVRLAGRNRFETSARIAQEFSEASVVFVANGLDFPDALSAARRPRF